MKGFPMSKNTSISLGDYFDRFVSSQLESGRYKNASEVIRAGLRLLENQETQALALKNAIEKGLNSPKVNEFDFDQHLIKLKSQKKENG
jgi:antitoxin ParD1/3/4